MCGNQSIHRAPPPLHPGHLPQGRELLRDPVPRPLPLRQEALCGAGRRGGGGRALPAALDTGQQFVSKTALKDAKDVLESVRWEMEKK